MPYSRVLVRFRLPPPSQDWSGLYWCNIDIDGEDITASVAPANLSGRMPNDSDFRVLESEQAQKLMVIEFLNTEKSAQLVQITAENAKERVSKYCVVMQEKSKYKFVFYQTDLQPQSIIWNTEESKRGKKSKELFRKEELEADPRLNLNRPTTEKTYHYDLLNYPQDSVLTPLYQQYQIWQQDLNGKILAEQALKEKQDMAEQKRIQAIEEEKQQKLRAAEEVKHQEQIHRDQWQNSPIDSDISYFLRDSLDELTQLTLHTQVCDALRGVKRLTLNQEQYAQVLCQLMNQTRTPSEYDPQLKEAIKRFVEDYLTNGGTLNGLFSDVNGAHPRFIAVYDYVLDIVFYELQKMDPSFIALNASQCKKTCSQSDAQVQLGLPRRENLLGGQIVADVAEDMELAFVLQQQELLSSLLSNRRNETLPSRRNRHRENVHGLFRPQPEPEYPRNNPQRLVEQQQNRLSIILGSILGCYALYMLITNFSWFALLLVLAVGVALSAVILQSREPLSPAHNLGYGRR